MTADEPVEGRAIYWKITAREPGGGRFLAEGGRMELAERDSLLEWLEHHQHWTNVHLEEQFA